MNPKYPIFIPTKGRFDTRMTIKTFEKIGVPYIAVVEEQEYNDYAKVVNEKKLLVLPHRDKGLTVTRNWIWDYALSKGYERFWTFDDNIDLIFRFNRNLKIQVGDGTILRIIEDFTERYKNAIITGMNYFMFASRKSKVPPYYLNTRIYSNMLIKTDIPYRNVTFYNDDTDLCLRVLKDGYCTILFNAFLIRKSQTMTVKGGMTDYYNKTDKRLQFAEELQKAHPGIVKITQKWGRWHHQVDYSGFKNNKLIRKPGLEIPEGINNYGMILKSVEK